MGILGNDSAFGKIFGTIGDIIILNILFIICSLPVFTIGSSFCGMYYAFMKKMRQGSDGIVKDFFKGFKDNFKQATISWIGLLIIAAIFVADFGLFGPTGPLPMMAVYYLCIIMSCMILFVALYLFPVICAFANTLKNLIAQAAFLAAKNFLYTLLIIIIYTIPVFMLLSSAQSFLVGICILATCGFGLISYLCSLIFVKIFTPYLPEIKTYTDEESDDTDNTKK